MAKCEDHCFVDAQHLGREFPEVHRWLDHFAATEGNQHRRRRHHREGVEITREQWGDQAALAAELHIMIDMGHIPSAADWERGGRVDPAGSLDYMDPMGLLESSFTSLASGIIVARATGYAKLLACSGCNDDSAQSLVDIRLGIFRCTKCGTTNQEREYRIEVPQRTDGATS